VDYVSTWQTPIDVKLGRARGFTYGLVCTELVERAGSGEVFAGRLVNRFGIENLRVATSKFTDIPESERPPDPVLAHRLAEFVEGLAPLVRPILVAADTSGRLELPVSRGVRRLIDVYGPKGLHPVRLSRNGRLVWGHRCDTLFERAAVETFELYATQAKLRRCIYCGSVYVPRRDERFCQWNLWPRLAVVGEAPLRLCSSDRHTAIRKIKTDERDQLQEHTRERKRLYAAEMRARQAALDRGEDPETALSVKKAREARERFVNDSPFRRGRKPTAIDTPEVTAEP
jgi:hypothetical protein